MAFTLTALNSAGATRLFYNVDWAVGYGAPSHKVDTMLVQALMQIFYYEQGGKYQSTVSNPIQLAPPAGYSSIEVDGLLGPATRAHIDTFQGSMCLHGWMLRVDHRMDPMRENPRAKSTIQQRLYALGLLNMACNNNDLTDGTQFFLGLRWREDMPAPLISALKTEKKMPDQYTTPVRVVPETGGV
ncbi:MAG: peptidoglycan-binding protein [Ottowia sp.]|uniref:peptidoglycan-binding protein n=1 Tax=unclassified Ottowia TaxID=2645081 RepID=UPI003C2F7864